MNYKERHTQNIDFKDTVEFLGRNGTFQSTGVQINNWNNHVSTGNPYIEIEPLTSRKLAGRCRIEIPTEHLPEFIKALQKYL
jgi:hypothetical protein